MSPAAEYMLRNGAWNPMWGGGGVIPGPGRDSLIPGEYVPGASTTGPKSPPVREVFPTSGDIITITSASDPRLIGSRFWGQVKWSTPVAFEDCVFAGPDPDGVTAIRGAIQNYGSAPQRATLTDCLVDLSLWLDPPSETGLTPRSTQSPWLMGIHGGNVDILRCEIVNCQDGFQFIGPSSSAAALTQSTRLWQSWLHRGYYTNDWYEYYDDGQPHTDGVQITAGQNLSIIGNLIGGERDAAGYLTWPGGYNSGDDFWNSGIIIKQEVDNSDLRRIENLLIRSNVIGGGTASINHAYTAARPNRFSTTQVIDNLIMERAVDWGYKMRGDTPGDPGYRADTTRDGGYEILRSAALDATYTNNRVLGGDGSIVGPATITNG